MRVDDFLDLILYPAFNTNTGVESVDVISMPSDISQTLDVVTDDGTQWRIHVTRVAQAEPQAESA
jgi:hypothetical protein